MCVYASATQLALEQKQGVSNLELMCEELLEEERAKELKREQKRQKRKKKRAKQTPSELETCIETIKADLTWKVRTAKQSLLKKTYLDCFVSPFRYMFL